MRLIYLILFLLSLATRVAYCDENFEEYEKSPARFFLSKILYLSGSLLDDLDLSPLKSERGRFIFRCTVQTATSDLYSVTVIFGNEIIESEIRSLEGGRVTVKAEKINAKSPVYREIIALQKLLEDPNFFAPLTYDEERFFELMTGGVWALFEVESDEYAGKISVIDQGEIIFRDNDPSIRNLKRYSETLRRLFGLWNIDVSPSDLNLKSVPPNPFR